MGSKRQWQLTLTHPEVPLCWSYLWSKSCFDHELLAKHCGRKWQQEWVTYTFNRLPLSLLIALHQPALHQETCFCLSIFSVPMTHGSWIGQGYSWRKWFHFLSGVCSIEITLQMCWYKFFKWHVVSPQHIVTAALGKHSTTTVWSQLSGWQLPA